jgi:heptosyltransferase-2
VAAAVAILGADPTPIAVLAPGASVARRCWPGDRFAELARWLGDEHGMRVVVLGGAVDRERVGVPELLATPGIIDAMGRLTLRSSAAVIRRASVFVGNDSGPAHLAAAVGTATVVVSAHPADGEPWMFNSPMRYRPWQVPSEVVQPPTAAPGCDRGCTAGEAHCIAQISVSAVHGAVEHVLAHTAR